MKLPKAPGLSGGVLLFLLLPTWIAGQSTELVSLAASGAASDDSSTYAAISADGRYVAFVSWANNLVSGDTRFIDVFVRDRQSGTTQRLSVGPGGVPGNGDCFFPSISADGRYVAFHSNASTLVAGDVNTQTDVFVHDRQSGTNVLASVASSGAQANGDSYDSMISADGRFVVFRSYATNLVAGDANDHQDTFVRDLVAGTTERVSVDALGNEGNGENWNGTLSADGRFVAFGSASSNLVAGDSNAAQDIFVRDRQSGTVELVSLHSNGTLGNGLSYFPFLSEDGRFVAFRTFADNLVSGDTNGFPDVLVRDRQNATTERVSIGTDGAQGNGPSYFAAISADGRFVAFSSEATNLVVGDTNGQSDVFLRDRRDGTTRRVSVASDGAQASGFSYWHSMTPDGRQIAFYSYAEDLVAGDGNGQGDVFVRTRGPLPLVGSLGDHCAAPYLTWSGSPALGEDYTVSTANLGLEDQLLLVDWSNISGGRPRLRVGAACQVYVTPDAVLTLGNAPDHTFSIPTDLTLLGVHLRTQARVLSSPSVTTQVLDALIGE